MWWRLRLTSCLLTVSPPGMMENRREVALRFPKTEAISVVDPLVSDIDAGPSEIDGVSSDIDVGRNAIVVVPSVTDVTLSEIAVVFFLSDVTSTVIAEEKSGIDERNRSIAG